MGNIIFSRSTYIFRIMNTRVYNLYHYNILCIASPQDGTKGVEEMDGRGRCPYDPMHNSTSIYAGDQLYSGTVADFSGSDPLIYKEPMRTERLDFKQLNGIHYINILNNITIMVQVLGSTIILFRF